MKTVYLGRWHATSPKSMVYMMRCIRCQPAPAAMQGLGAGHLMLSPQTLLRTHVARRLRCALTQIGTTDKAQTAWTWGHAAGLVSRDQPNAENRCHSLAPGPFPQGGASADSCTTILPTLCPLSSRSSASGTASRPLQQSMQDLVVPSFIHGRRILPCSLSTHVHPMTSSLRQHLTADSLRLMGHVQYTKSADANSKGA